MRLTIPRSMLDEIRKGMSKIISSNSTIPVYQHIKIESEPGKLRAVGTDGESALMFDAPIEENADGSGSCLLPVKEMSNIPGRARDIVTITAENEKKVCAEVASEGVVEKVHFSVPPVDKFPDIAFEDDLKFRKQAGDAAELIRYALRCTDNGPTRYSLNCLALEPNRIVATNGRKLFAGNSFAFPWRSKQPKLIPASKVFGCSAIRDAGDLSVAFAEGTVYFRFGDRWTLKLPVVEGSFPDWEPVVPKKARASIEFTEEDARQLIERLPTLPGDDDDNMPVGLLVDGSVRVLGKGERGQCETLDLPNATVTGRKAEIGFNRAFLIDGLKMGMRRFDIVGPNQPIVSRDDKKLFLFMPLGEAKETEQKKKETKKMENGKKNQTTGNNGADMDAIMGRLASLKDQAKRLLGTIVETEKAIKGCANDMRKREKLVKSTISSLKGLKELSG